MLQKRPKPTSAAHGGIIKETVQSLIISLSTFGDELYELKRFADMNVTGFQKILKKHDKNRPHHKLHRVYWEEKLPQHSFFNQQRLQQLLTLVQTELEMLELMEKASRGSVATLEGQVSLVLR